MVQFNVPDNTRSSGTTEQGLRMRQVFEQEGSADLKRQEMHPKVETYANGSSSEGLPRDVLAGAGAKSEFSLPPMESDAVSDGEHSEEHDVEEYETAFKFDPKANSRARMIVIAVMLFSAGLVGFLTYWFVSENEEHDFTDQFHVDARLLIQQSNDRGRHSLATLRRFADLLARKAETSGAMWPFYTMSDFEDMAAEPRLSIGATHLVVAPWVEHVDRGDWEAYSVQNQWWIEEGLNVRGVDTIPNNITSYIFRQTDTGATPAWDFAEYCPAWQMSPPPTDTSPVNYNLFSLPTFSKLTEISYFSRQPVISEVVDVDSLRQIPGLQLADEAFSVIVMPVSENADNPGSAFLGFVVALIPMSDHIQNVLLEGKRSLVAEFRESCGKEFSYQVEGTAVKFLGEGRFHHLVNSGEVETAERVTFEGDRDLYGDYWGGCESTFAIYPGHQYQEQYESNDAVVYTVAVVLFFVFMAAIFASYDWYVSKKHRKLKKKANKADAIITSLFPAQVREKLYTDAAEGNAQDVAGEAKSKRRASFSAAAAGLITDDPIQNGEAEIDLEGSPPIADLFPSATVLFMDIAGFTAWSSQREPSQVFILLETIYRNFDSIAKQRKVFKVETIGDCYVAVCGLPEPCTTGSHAVVMARFARDCLEKMNELVRKLEAALGPDTAELAMRAGLNSGPVTAGVLRGDRARFQLFGDTVNTAARMESTGVKKKIQISQETAELIAADGKENWIKAREDVVHAKGKGELQTFWLLPRRTVEANSQGTHSVGTGESETDLQEYLIHSTTEEEHSVGSNNDIVDVQNERVQRLVHYTGDILLKILKKIAAKRVNNIKPSQDERRRVRDLEETIGKVGICLEEVVEVIELPGFDSSKYDTRSVDISEAAVSQLNSFLDVIASLYRMNPFHNFDHASHVTQSVSKLLSRIVAVKHIEEEEQNDHTYGITSDPLTQFAIVFSSLIHDVDHRGVPNAALVEEDPALGTLYKNQAVAEQNSVDVAWNLLMDPLFEELRMAIYSSEAELKRFRQLVVNSLMATDIFDKQLGSLRRQRWENAFFGEHTDEDPQISMNRKATIVIEHIIQASDVSHTMQHWHVYSKWNDRLYHEMFTAYCDGRSEKDPTEGWYKGELWFFDNYVIPLAKKLKECGVFGVSSDEYLNYAEANRREWEKKGKEIVAENFEKYKQELEYRHA